VTTLSIDSSGIADMDQFAPEDVTGSQAMPDVRGGTDAHKELSAPFTDRPTETKSGAQIGVGPLIEGADELDPGLNGAARTPSGLLRDRASTHSQP